MGPVGKLIPAIVCTISIEPITYNYPNHNLGTGGLIDAPGAQLVAWAAGTAQHLGAGRPLRRR